MLCVVQATKAIQQFYSSCRQIEDRVGHRMPWFNGETTGDSTKTPSPESIPAPGKEWKFGKRYPTNIQGQPLQKISRTFQFSPSRVPYNVGYRLVSWASFVRKFPNIIGYLLAGGKELYCEKFFSQIHFFSGGALSTFIHLFLGKAGPFTLESHIHVKALKMQRFPNN